MTDQSNERDGNEPDGVLSWFVDRPVLTSMVSLTLLLVGIISFSRLPLALTPEGLTADTLNVIVPVRGASMSPTEVEELIVRPFEEQLGTVAGIDRVRSRASSGRASFNIRLEQGADLTIVTSEVRDRAQRAQLEWPEDSNRFLMWREDGSSAPLAFVQFLAPARNPEWDYLIDKVLRPRIEAVDGVGRLDVFGILDETIRVQFDREKLIEFRLDYGQLLQRLSSENFVEPVGELDDGSSRYLLRVDTRFAEDRQIEEWPIRTGLTLQDVATIERVPSIRDSLSRFATPPKPGEAMQAYYTYTAIVRAAAGSNQVEASESLVRALEDLRSEDPRFEKFDWRFLFNQGTLIKSSLDTLLNTSLQGAGLALVVLWLFLRSVRFTVTIALAIPGALLVAGAFLFFSKSSLNLLTMAGMTLAVGMVVDNAVVVLENIQRLRGKGMPARDACVRGTRDVVLALSMATLTTVAVLVPFMFVGEDGNLRVALTAFGMPVCVALIGSLGVALLLLPGGVRFLAGRDAVRTPATERRGLGLLFDPVSLVTRMNRLLLQLSLRSFWTRTTAALALAGVLATVAIPFANIDYVDADGGGPFSGGDVTINLEIPRGYTLRDVDQRVREYEQFIGGHADEWEVRFVSTRFDRTSIRVDIALAEDLPREIAVKTGNAIRNAWPRVPGITQTLRNAGGNDGAGAGSEEKSQNNFVVRLYGPNSDFLAQLAVRTQKRLAARREVERVEVGSIDGNSEVVVQVDRDQMQRLGVDPAQLARVAGAGLRGTELTRIEDRGREIPLIAEFAGGTPGLFDLGETRGLRTPGRWWLRLGSARRHHRHRLRASTRNDQPHRRPNPGELGRTTDGRRRQPPDDGDPARRDGRSFAPARL